MNAGLRDGVVAGKPYASAPERSFQCGDGGFELGTVRLDVMCSNGLSSQSTHPAAVLAALDVVPIEAVRENRFKPVLGIR